MSDPFEDYMGFRRGENEPAPQEPDDVTDDRTKDGDSLREPPAMVITATIIPEIGRYDAEPEIAQNLAQRDNLQRQIDGNMANVRMLLNAVFGIKR